MSAVLSAIAGLTVSATAGPDLWSIYTAAAAKAQASEQRWHEGRLAGGWAGTMGNLYTQAYIDRLAASTAYWNWVQTQPSR